MSFDNRCPWCKTSDTTITVSDYKLGRVEVCQPCIIERCPTLWAALQERKRMVERQEATRHARDEVRALKLLTIGKQPEYPRHAYINGHSYCSPTDWDECGNGSGPLTCLKCLRILYPEAAKLASRGRRKKR